MLCFIAIRRINWIGCYFLEIIHHIEFVKFPKKKNVYVRGHFEYGTELATAIFKLHFDVFTFRKKLLFIKYCAKVRL